MGYRFCPECDRWLDHEEYTFADDGETVCPEHDEFYAVHGLLEPGRDPLTEDEFYRAMPAWYGDRSAELAAAKRQGLVQE